VTVPTAPRALCTLELTSPQNAPTGDGSRSCTTTTFGPGLRATYSQYASGAPPAFGAAGVSAATLAVLHLSRLPAALKVAAAEAVAALGARAHVEEEAA